MPYKKRRKPAYSELYIEKAQLTLGSMLDYAVYDLKMDIRDFYKMFLHTRIADAFGSGDPKYTVGMSGAELADEVLHEITGEYTYKRPGYRFYRTPEYWAGWALAYYEWYSSIPFARIEESVPIDEIVEMYHPYHEADISKFTDAIDSKINSQ
ncbi:MAG: hypothetical protein K6E16_12720 [Lachnospiraceae bacterium]|nr:hypothetical protein [Lachnospiraceae bacterium]